MLRLPTATHLDAPAPGSGGVLVGAADGGVHRHSPADVVSTVGRRQERGENPLPSAVHGPPDQPSVSKL